MDVAIDKYIVPPGLNKNHKESLFKTHPRVIERNATLQSEGIGACYSAKI